MGIFVRRGMEKDFDPEKMKPGEWAVSIDSDRRKQKIWMCFSPGVVKRLGTYEDFEDQIQDATSEIKQQYLTAFSDILAQIEQDKNTAADEYAYIVSFKDSLEKTYIPEIANSIAAAANSATAANTAQEAAATYKDNAKTYMDNAAAYSKEAKAAASSITGALKPKGTVNFEELPDLADADSGDMYNVANEFVSTADYKDGGGITYPSGTNVYKTEDGMWDCLGGQLSDYLMRDDIDAAVEESMPDYTSNSYMENLVAGEKLSKALGKIKIAVKNVIALVKLLGTTDISKIADGSVTGALNAHDNSINSLNSSLVNINSDRLNNIYADSSHAYPLICKDILTGQMSTEQAVIDAVTNGFFNTNGAYIGLIIHGSWEFYTAIAVNDAKYISVLIHDYSGEIHQLVWSGGKLVNHRIL